MQINEHQNRLNLTQRDRKRGVARFDLRNTPQKEEISSKLSKLSKLSPLSLTLQPLSISFPRSWRIRAVSLHSWLRCWDKYGQIVYGGPSLIENDLNDAFAICVSYYHILYCISKFHHRLDVDVSLNSVLRSVLLGAFDGHAKVPQMACWA